MESNCTFGQKLFLDTSWLSGVQVSDRRSTVPPVAMAKQCKSADTGTGSDFPLQPRPRQHPRLGLNSGATLRDGKGSSFTVEQEKCEKAASVLTIMGLLWHFRGRRVTWGRRGGQGQIAFLKGRATAEIFISFWPSKFGAKKPVVDFLWDKRHTTMSVFMLKWQWLCFSCIRWELLLCYTTQGCWPKRLWLVVNNCLLHQFSLFCHKCP